MKTPIKLLLKFFLVVTILHCQTGHTAMPDELSVNQWKCGLVAARPIAEWAQRGMQEEAEANLFRDLDADQRATIEAVVGAAGINRPLTIRQVSILITPEMSTQDRFEATRAVTLLSAEHGPATLFGMIDFMRGLLTWEKRQQVLLHCLAHEGAKTLDRRVKFAIGDIFSNLPAGSSLATFTDILQVASHNRIAGPFLAFVGTQKITDLKTMAVIAQIPTPADWETKLIEILS